MKKKYFWFLLFLIWLISLLQAFSTTTLTWAKEYLRDGSLDLWCPRPNDHVFAREVTFSIYAPRYVVLNDAGIEVERLFPLLHIQIFRRNFSGERVFEQILRPLSYEQNLKISLPEPGGYVWRVREKSPRTMEWKEWVEGGYFLVDWSPPWPPPRGLRTEINSRWYGLNDIKHAKFLWPTILGTREAEIEISDSPDFSNVITYSFQKMFIPEGTSGCSPCSRSPDMVDGLSLTVLDLSKLESGEYYWRVRVRRDSGWSDWSTPATFTLWRRVWLIAPEDGAIWHPISPNSNFTQVCFSWKLIDPLPTTSSNYKLKFSLMKVNTIYQINEDVDVNLVGTCIDIPNNERFGEGDYIWGVRDPAAPKFPIEGEGLEGLEKRKLRIIYIPAKPEIISPVENAKLLSFQTPIFKWRKALHATSYELELRAGSYSGKVVLSERISPFVGVIIGSEVIESYKLSNPLPVGKYVLKIRSIRNPPNMTHRETRSSWAVRHFEIIEPIEKPIEKEKISREVKIFSSSALPSGRESRGTPLTGTDSSPPNIKILLPKSDERIKVPTIPANITIVAEVSDTGSPASGIDRVEFWANGRKATESRAY